MIFIFIFIYLKQLNGLVDPEFCDSHVLQIVRYCRPTMFDRKMVERRLKAPENPFSLTNNQLLQ